ncbi:FtsW/RodA/SpoVE family cell cycle protein, partial [uncultured Acetatifactor sp.]
MFKRYRLRDYDFKLVLLILALSAVGVIAVGSAEPSLQNKQLAGVVAGVVLMVVVSLFDYTMVIRLNWLMYVANLVLLVAVWQLGDETKGATRWLTIGGLRFQPSETAKILLILFFAQFIMKHRKK